MAKRSMPVKYEVAELEEPVNNFKMVEVSCERLNIRAKPTKESKVLTTVPYGTRLIAKSLEGVWYRVGSIDDENFEGFVLSAFVQEVSAYG